MTAVSGIGLVTPFGADLEEIWRRLSDGSIAPVSQLTTNLSEKTFPYLPVPREVIRATERHPRMRRSSEISHFAVLAGMNALADSGLDPKSGDQRIGVVFAISSGGVHYTTRFYDQIVRDGAAAASPLLFPETVYNAPASHLAALLGLDGISYTLVGDSSVGMAALAFGADLLAMDQLDHCVVVACEEADWILSEAFHSWRYFQIAEQVRAFGGPGKRATVFSEGAAALVLSREGPLRLEKIQPGTPFFRARYAQATLQKILGQIEDLPGAVISGANGTRLDDAEAAALAERWPQAPVYAPKNSLGESLGASVLQQAAVAALALRENRSLPGLDFLTPSIALTAIGYSGQAAAALLRKSS